MDTIKTCTLDDSKRHVCFADLDQYWRKDEYLSGLNDIEKFQIKQNLGIVDNDLQVDSYIDKTSKFPVQNRAIAHALDKKADINALSRLAITGQYADLKNAPCNLPNPEGLIFNTNQGSWFYDGTDRIEIEFPTKLSEFENDSLYIDRDFFFDNVKIDGIRVNGTEVQPDFTKVVDITIPSKVSDLIDAENYVTLDQMTNEVRLGSLKPVTGNAVAQKIQELNATIAILRTQIDNLQTAYEQLRQQ